jgi:uncharacterized cupin superfamily protein
MEAHLEDVGSGLAPVSEGWFVVKVREAAWLTNAAFGARCVFESDARVLRIRGDLIEQRFPDVGITLAVLEPGRPSGLYHAESAQEDFLVLAGACIAIVEGEERRLRQWDLLHCPAGTAHVFVGAGDGPCVLFMVGARTSGKTIVYPRSDAALGQGAGVEEEMLSPREAYRPFPHWQLGRPASTEGLPWEADDTEVRRLSRRRERRDSNPRPPA